MRNTFKYFLSLFVLSFPAMIPAGISAMTVSIEPGTLKDNKQADMNLSGLILRKVQWEDGAVLMPVTIANDRSYNDVKLVSRDLYLKMEDCFINGCRESSPADRPTLPSVRIDAIKKLNSKFRVSNIEVMFDNAVSVSVGIMAENYPDGTYWLSYPQSVGFASKVLQEHTDNVIFKAFADENPHLKVVRAAQPSSLSSSQVKEETEKEPEETEKISVVKTPVFEDEPRTSKKRKARSKKNTTRKTRRKKNSSADGYYYGSEDISGVIYDAR